MTPNERKIFRDMGIEPIDEKTEQAIYHPPVSERLVPELQHINQFGQVERWVPLGAFQASDFRLQFEIARRLEMEENWSDAEELCAKWRRAAMWGWAIAVVAVCVAWWRW